MEITTNRNEHLDILKGCLILLVVWGHAIQYGFGFEYGENYYFFKDDIYKLIYSFHMPLFMGISGYLFYFSLNKGFYKNIRSKINGILIPYMFYCTLLAILSLSTWKNNHAELVKLYANGFWFLTSVMLNMIIVGSIVRCVKQGKWQNIFLCVIALIVLFIPEYYLYDTHAYVLPAFIIGYLINKYKLHFNLKKWMCLPAIICLVLTPFLFTEDLFIYTTGINIYEWGGQINFGQLRIDIVRWIFALVNSLCFLIIIGLIRWPKYLKDKLSTLSRYSIGIYCLSILIQMILYKINNHLLHISIPHNYLTPVLYTIVTTIICERILYFAQKYKMTRLLFLGGR